MKILLIEDSALWRTEFLMRLEELGFENIEVCKNIDDAICILESKTIDLIISDIHLEELTIFDLFKTNQKYSNIPFVFVTVSTEIENYNLSKQVKKSTFLIKPFHQLSLKAAIDGLMHQDDINDNSPKGINIKGKYGVKFFLDSSKIIYIKSELAYCKIKTDKNQYVIKNNMKNLCAEIGPDIIQIHRTYAVNKINIIKADFTKNIVLTKLAEIPIGRAYKKNLIVQLSNNDELK